MNKYVLYVAIVLFLCHLKTEIDNSGKDRISTVPENEKTLSKAD